MRLGGSLKSLAARWKNREHDKIDQLLGENWTIEHLRQSAEIGLETCVHNLELKFWDKKVPDAEYVLNYFREDRLWYIELHSPFDGDFESHNRVRDAIADSLKARAAPNEPRMVNGQYQRVDVMITIGRFGFAGMVYCMSNFFRNYGDMLDNPAMTAKLFKVPQDVYIKALEQGIPLKPI